MTRNKLEIRVCGLQRSGNHAIIDWVINQYPGATTCFLNNVRHGNYNPFETKTQLFTYNFKGFPNGRVDKDHKSLDELGLAPKDILIYSYEDDRTKLIEGESFLNSAYSQDFEKKRQDYLGKSHDFIDVLIVRDPYNFFASRLKKFENLTGVRDIDTIIENLKDVLRNSIDLEASPNPKKLLIKYNQWAIDKEYRKGLSKKIGGKFNDSSLKVVSKVGGGSSFDGTNFNKLRLQDLWYKRKRISRLKSFQNLSNYWSRLFVSGAQEMNTAERWKNSEDVRMEKIMSDPEISDLSKKLFGNVLNQQES